MGLPASVRLCLRPHARRLNRRLAQVHLAELRQHPLWRLAGTPRHCPAPTVHRRYIKAWLLHQTMVRYHAERYCCHQPVCGQRDTLQAANDRRGLHQRNGSNLQVAD